jgi:NDP-4-keto-2,6-dideoxyhexose 3-C-methyltransferase
MAFTGIFPQAATEVVPDGPLELVQCHGEGASACGLVQLRHTFDPHVLFGRSYGYRSGLNPSMTAHLQEVALKVKSLVVLKPGDLVVDIGSNDGTLLQFFSRQAFGLVGIDPTAADFTRYYPADARIISDFFSADLFRNMFNTRKAKVISSIAVFYDVADPLEFLNQACAILSDDGILVLEQSYWPQMLRNNIYDTVCHEHVGYYGARQIQWLADRVGLKVVHAELNSINGGSLCVILAKQDAPFTPTDDMFNRLVNEEQQILANVLTVNQNFREHVVRHRDVVRQRIREFRTQGLSVAGYGASTKGNVLLQFCGFTTEDISFIAEINENKWGKFCPGTQIPIISEEEAMVRRPDVLLVLPWHWKEPLLVKERSYLHQGGAMFFPWPEMHLVRG